MNKTFLSALVVVLLGMVACTNSKSLPGSVGAQPKSTSDMKNLISIVEIPTADFSRAKKFYENVLALPIEEVDMAGTKMGVLPNDPGTVNVVLVNGADYKPAGDGAVLYLNAGTDLQPTLDRVQQHGGTVIVPKTNISAEMGYYALFIDTEGNRMGLHSEK